MKKRFYIDASALKNAACWRQLCLRILKHTRGETDRDYKIAYGSAGHIFLDGYYRGKTPKDAAREAYEYYKKFEDQISPSEREFRTPSHLLDVIKAYTKIYPRSADGIIPDVDGSGEALVENTFSVPVRSNDLFELFFCGTIDLCCTYFGICNVFVDHKFIGQYYKEGYFNSYEFDIQMATYSLAYLKVLKIEHIPSFLINGVFIKKGTQKARDEGEFDGVVFQRSQVFSYSRSKLEAFEKWLEKKFDKLWETINNPNLDKIIAEDYDMACCKTPFGLCDYFNLCAAPAEFWTTILEHKYNTKVYEPLKFREI